MLLMFVRRSISIATVYCDIIPGCWIFCRIFWEGYKTALWTFLKQPQICMYLNYEYEYGVSVFEDLHILYYISWNFVNKPKIILISIKCNFWWILFSKIYKWTLYFAGAERCKGIPETILKTFSRVSHDG